MILDDPFDDPDGLQVPDRSPEPTKEQLDVRRFLQLIHSIKQLICQEFPTLYAVLVI